MIVTLIIFVIFMIICFIVIPPWKTLFNPAVMILGVYCVQEREL